MAETRVNTTTLGDQSTTSPSLFEWQPAQVVATDAAGNFVVTWTSDSTADNDGDGAGVYIQRYSSTGTTLGGEIRVNTTTTGNQQSSNVAMDSNGAFAVTWTAPDGSGNGTGLYFQLYDNAGTAKGSEILVNNGTLGTQELSTIAMDDSGNIIVAWTSDSAFDINDNLVAGDGDGTGVFIRHYKVNSTTGVAEAQTTELLVNTASIAGDQSSVVIAMNGNGQFVVAWVGEDVSGTGIFAQRYQINSTTGAVEALGAEIAVNGLTNLDQLDPSIAIDNSGNFVVSWTTLGGNGRDVMARRFNAAGVALDAQEVVVNTTTGSDQQLSSVAMDADGDFIVTWSSPGDGSGTAIFGQRFNNAGARVGSQFRINTTTVGNQQFSSVAMDTDGDVVAVWTSRPTGIEAGQDGDESGVYYDRLPAPDTLSISDVTQAEGSGANTSFRFTVTLSTISAQTVTVDYTTAINTAGLGDLISTANTLTFNPGETTKTVTVSVVGDAIDEVDETFFVNLSNASGATIADAQGLGTILDDDLAPSISVGNVSVNEGNSGTTNSSFVVSLSGASGRTITVDYGTADGTATTANNDYTSTAGSLTFNPGEITKTITVGVTGDTINEANETFQVNLSNAINASISGSPATGTITNDDVLLVNITAVDASAAEAGSDPGTYRVTRNGSSGDLTINLTTTGSTASPADYNLTGGSIAGTAPNYTVVIPNGQTSVDFTLTPIDDAISETTESLQLNLAAGSYSIGANSSATVLITDNEPLPDLSIGNVSVAEGNSGTTNATFVVSLSAASGLPVTVNYATADGTAIAGTDYTSGSGILTFNPGETVKTITVSVTGDTLNEANETFQVTLSNPTNAGVAIGQGTGTSTITNDDPAPTVSIGNATVTEGNTGVTNAIFTVSLSGVSGQVIAVDYGTADGTATTANSDYGSASGTLTFNPGETLKTITVGVNGDVLNETDETFQVNLTNPTNVSITGGQGIGTITNDDVLTVNIIATDAAADEQGSDPGVYRISRNSSSGDLTVNLINTGSTASSGDYTLSGGGISGTEPNFSVIIPDGQSFVDVTLTPIDDLQSEANETLKLDLASGSYSIGASSSATVTINDNEPKPSLAIANSSVTEGNSGTTSAAFVVSLSEASGQVITVDYLTANGTAIAGTDYTNTTGTLTFNPGETVKTFTVNILGDTLNEADETFQVNLTNPINASISNVAVGTILNDDAVPTLNIGNTSIVEGNLGTSNATFTVSLSGASGQVVTVDYATADGTATTIDSDYTATSGKLTFTPGETVKTITVGVNGDTLNEANETFTVNLSNATNGSISGSPGTGTITNDDTLVVNITALDADAAEAGTDPGVYRISRNGVSGDLTVNLSTTGSTAVPADYSLAGGSISGTAPNFTVVIPNGQSFVDVTMTPVDDAQSEASEILRFTLAAGSYSIGGSSSAQVIITDDEPLPDLSIGNISVAEGNSGTTNAAFVVSLSAVSGQAVTVDYATSNGTAIAGSDYTSGSGTLTFNPGETAKTITVGVTGDVVNEANETFQVTLSNPTNAGVGIGQEIGTSTITNDDPVANISVNNVTVTEGNTGTTNATFTVSLSAVSGQVITVDYATADGTATIADNDYANTSGSLTFNPGETVKTITVGVAGDILSETNETFTVNLSNATNASITGSPGTGTITNDDTLVVNITATDAAAAEAGSNPGVYRISRNGSGGDATISLTTTGSTASPSDYNLSGGSIAGTPPNFTVVIPNGQSFVDVTMTPVDDAISEASETLTFNLAPSGAYSIGANSSATVIITDNEPLPDLSIGNVSVAEGNSGTTNATFVVNLSATSGQVVTVDYETSDGTAIAGSDYSDNFGILTFNPGETAKTITVSVTGDTLNEANETFQVTLSNPFNAGIGIGQDVGTGTITNDDPVANIGVSNTTITEGNTGTTNATFTVSLSAASGQVVTVDYATADGAATLADNDYTSAAGTLTFNPGETVKTITVGVTGDVFSETNETFTVNLSNAINGSITGSPGTGTITNDDTLIVNITALDAAAAEAGTDPGVYRISRNGSGGDATISLTTTGSTASPSDYNLAGGSIAGTAPNFTIVIPNGQSFVDVTMTPVDDAISEASETLQMNLAPSGSYSIGANSSATVIITDNEPLPELRIGNVSVAEGNSGTTNATFVVSLAAVSGQTVTVDYATSNGTAIAGTDYSSASGSLTFNPGETAKTITVSVTGDTLNEANETFQVTLSNSTNAGIGVGQDIGTGTITNDDPVANISVGNATVTEGNAGTTNATFTVSLSATSGQTVTVDYATADGTATAGSDYISAAGSLTFNPGETVKTVTVGVTGDVVNEANETFQVNLSNASNASISGSPGTGTITNDDTLVVNIAALDADAAEAATDPGVYRISRNGSSGAVTISLTNTGSTTSAADYNLTGGSVAGTAPNFTIIIPNGQSFVDVTMTPIDDALSEAPETLTLNLAPSGSYSIGANSSASVTIADNEALPTLSIGNASIIEGNSGTTNSSFVVSLSEASGQTVTVDYATSNGTAIAGSDYTSGSGKLTFNPGETVKTILVGVTGDAINEANETFQVTLSNATNAGIGAGQNIGTGTITNDDPVPSLTIGNATVTEGNSGTTNATFIVSLSASSGQTVTVDYASANGTATAGTDYNAIAGNLTFNPGETVKTITVGVLGDTLNEVNETFQVNLSNASNASIFNSQGTGNITNDDAPPTLSMSDASVTEGNSGTTNATFTVSLSALSGQTVTVNYGTVDGTATSVSGDYTNTSGSLTFTPGESVKTITVGVNGDTLNELDESFSVSLSGATNASITDGQGVGTITNDDGLPSLTISDITVTEGNSGSTNAIFLVSLSAASGQAVRVDYTTANGSATTVGGDYTSAAGTLTFNPGETLKTITIGVNGDLLNEPDETFSVNLSNAASATIGDNQGIGTITNDDAQPSLSIGNVTVNEGNSGTTNALFVVNLSAASGQAVTVDYVTNNGTATTANGDYVASNGTLTFNPGETSKTITVAVNGDLFNEPNETFSVGLSNAVNAGITTNQGTGTITNDDAPPSLRIGDVSVSEGSSGTTNATFVVSLSAASGQVVTVDYASADGTATTANGDYTSTAGSLTFNPGETLKTITVAVNGDLLNEPNETFSVNLSNAGNAAIADNQGIGTITNDDGTPSLSLNDVIVAEGNSGTTDAVFVVNLSAASGQIVTVDYATANGTATTANADYVNAAGTLTFNLGEIVKTITVKVNGDLVNEADEGFTVNLSNVSNAAIADNQGTGTITNDDVAPGLSIGDATVTEGNSGSTNTTFVVSLSAASGQTVTVDYATNDGSATAVGGDYTGTSGKLTFNPGETLKTITVSVNGDTLSEANETFTVNLNNPINAGTTDNQGIGTIANDDIAPVLTITDATLTEGNSGTSNAIFTVSLSANSGQAVTVDYATANGTATIADGDYSAVAGTLTFNPGERVKTITVQVNGDLRNEANETFTVNLSNATNVTVGDNQGLGTITNDDTQPTLSIGDVSQLEGNGGTTNYAFAVSLSAASGQAVTVNYTTADGTALVADGDYTATNGTLTFNPGELVKTITVGVAGDTKFEANELFNLNLSAASNAAIADSNGVGTITNDDQTALVNLSLNNASFSENGGSTVVTATLSNATAQGVTVSLGYSGSALLNSDYSASGSSIFIPAGSLSGSVTLTGINDLFVEANETILVDITNVTNATENGTQQVTATIASDDINTPPVANSISNQVATEDLAFTFTFAANTFQDNNPGDVLSYSAQLLNGDSLPNWLTFNPTTRTFSGTPRNGDVGILNIVVTATDLGANTANSTFTLTINNVNDAPSVNAPLVDQTVAVGNPLTYSFAANSFVDVDAGDSLTYTARLDGGAPLPGWLTFDATTRTFSGTPPAGSVGTVSVRVFATDQSFATVSDVFNLTVTSTSTSNTAPTVTAPIPNQNATEDTPFSFTFAAGTFTDPDVGDVLTYTARLADGSPLPSWLTFDPITRTFSGTPLNGNTGNLSIQVVATDQANTSASTVFDLAIANVNDAPVLTPSRPSFSYISNLGAVVLDDAFTLVDIDSPNLTGASVSITGFASGEDLLDFTDQNGIVGLFNSATGILTLSGASSVANYEAALRSITYQNNSANAGSPTRTFTVNVSDGQATGTASLQVVFNNRAPVIDLNGLDPGTGFSTTGSANVPIKIVDTDLSISDVDGTTLSSALVIISNPIDWIQEELLVSTAGTNITAIYKPDSGTLSLSGTASIADYQKVLRTVTYRNQAVDPNATVRKILFLVNDGVSNSVGAETTLTLISQNPGLPPNPVALVTTPEKDVINAPAGNDTLTSILANLQQNDQINGGGGIDSFILTDGTGTAAVNVNSTTNQLTGITPAGTVVLNFEQFDFSAFKGNATMIGSNVRGDVLSTGSGNDNLSGGVGNDILNSNAGNDRLDGGVGDDILTGGSGNDTYLVNSVNDLVIENFNGGIDTIQSSVSLALSSDLENLTLTGTARRGQGNGSNNTITGNGRRNVLIGSAGKDILLGAGSRDRLVGGTGNDELVGGAGLDRLTGGVGRDRFVLGGDKKRDRDVIRDFRHNIDKLVISNDAFNLNLGGKRLSASRFTLGTKAQDQSDRFIYNRQTGALFFDKDGTGSAAQIQIATLVNKPVLSNADFSIIA